MISLKSTKFSLFHLLTALMAGAMAVKAYDGVQTGKIVLSQLQAPTLSVTEALAQSGIEPIKDDNMPNVTTMDEPDLPSLDTPVRDAYDASGESLIFDEGMSNEEIELLQSLAKRRQELETKEKELRTREALLAAAEKQVEMKTQELMDLRKEIENLIGVQQKEQEARINSLVKTYENMKSKDAARIFDTLDMDVLLPVIGRMSERKMAPILAEMESEKARLVTIRLAEQKKLPEIAE